MTTQQSSVPPISFIVKGETFLTQVDPEERYLITELLPEETICLVHGEPRVKKSWACLEIGLAVATGMPAFGMEQFSVPSPGPVLYCSQEDGAKKVRNRIKRLITGKGLAPKDAYLLDYSIHANINLDKDSWRHNLHQAILENGYKLVIFDPIRRFSLHVDKGPSEVAAVSAILRDLAAKTGCTILIDHHDIKPPQMARDTRRRGHRASGGDWFAASDCPICFETVDGATQVFPEDYKFSHDPDPFLFRLEEDHDKTFIRLIGSPLESAHAKLEADILDFLEDGPKTTKQIKEGVKGKADYILAALAKLVEAGVVWVEHGVRGSKIWHLKRP